MPVVRRNEAYNSALLLPRSSSEVAVSNGPLARAFCSRRPHGQGGDHEHTGADENEKHSQGLRRPAEDVPRSSRHVSPRPPAPAGTAMPRVTLTGYFAGTRDLVVKIARQAQAEGQDTEKPRRGDNGHPEDAHSLCTPMPATALWHLLAPRHPAHAAYELLDELGQAVSPIRPPRRVGIVELIQPLAQAHAASVVDRHLSGVDAGDALVRAGTTSRLHVHGCMYCRCYTRQQRGYTGDLRAVATLMPVIGTFALC
jgi:hypothetical protein